MLHITPLMFFILLCLLFVLLGFISVWLLRSTKQPPKPDRSLADLPSKRAVYFALLDNYTMEEIEELCLRLSIDSSRLPGDSKPFKARALIDDMDERDRYAELVAAIRQDYPDAFRRRAMPPRSGESG